jgi:hypothetical protein
MPKKSKSPAVTDEAGIPKRGNRKLPEEAKPFMWKPGQSGNPNGRPRSTTEMKQQAASHTDTALKLKSMVTELQLKQAIIYAEMSEDPRLSVEERLEALNKAIKSIDSVGLGAAQSLLDRGHGKPQQKVEIDSRTALDEMDDDEVAVFIGKVGPQVVGLIQARRKKVIDE